MSVENALYGSFLPIPCSDLFPLSDPLFVHELPGAVISLPAPIPLNAGKAKFSLRVANTGDRPIQVGSHYPFVETNPHLAFDRFLAYEKCLRLDIPAGTAVRFEPGELKTVTLVEMGGKKIISGGGGISVAVRDHGRNLEEVLNEGGFKVAAVGEAKDVTKDKEMHREIVSFHCRTHSFSIAASE